MFQCSALCVVDIQYLYLTKMLPYHKQVKFICIAGKVAFQRAVWLFTWANLQFVFED